MKRWFESDADYVARQIQETYGTIGSLSARMAITGTFGPNRNTFRFAGSVQLQRPDRWRYEAAGERNEVGAGIRQFRYRLISDGQTAWRLDERAGRYVQQPTRQRDTVLPPLDPIGRLFFTESWLLSDGGQRTTRLLPAATIDGFECGGVEIVRVGIDTMNRFTLYADRDFHVQRVIEVYQESGSVDTTEATLQKLRIDRPLPAATFAFTPPRHAARTDESIERGSWLLGWSRP